MSRHPTTSYWVSVPVIATWCCSHCGKQNNQAGTILFVREYSTTQYPDSEKEKKDRDIFELEWRNHITELQQRPNDYQNEMRYSLDLPTKKCCHCGHKEAWARQGILMRLQGIYSFLTFLVMIYDLFTFHGGRRERKNHSSNVGLAMFVLYYIFLFLEEQWLKKRVNMVAHGSRVMVTPYNIDSCNVYSKTDK